MPVRSHVHPSGQTRQSYDRDYNNGDSSGSRPSSPTWRDETGSELRGRTSTDATPRPTPTHPRNLGSVATHDTNSNILGNSSSASDFFSPSRRLALFGGGGDKGSSSQGHHQHNFSTSSLATARGPIPTQLLPPRTHSRAESALALAREASASPIPSISGASMASSSTLTASKAHTSPSKVSTGRTYDSKLVVREMHRLGNLAHLPSALAPALSAAASATSLALPTQSSSSAANISGGGMGDNPWGSLHVHVLPLFVGEPLRIPIEDLNVLVREHIRMVLSQSPSKALATLENDASELIATGMVTLNAKFIGIEDEKLVGRVVEIWGFFWDQVLPYVEGVLLPLQTSSLLSSLYRTPKTHRTSSPNRQSTKSSIASMHTLQLSAYSIDVRTVALRSFRDRVILPLFPRLFARISMPNRQDSFTDSFGYQQPRLQQMLLVLASQSQQRPSTFSLTEPAPQPTPGEAAICDLLRMLRSPRPHGLVPSTRKSKSSSVMTVRAPASFFSGGMPGDRRGRIAQKTLKGKGRAGDGHEGDEDESDGFLGDGGETPRIGLGSAVFNAEREHEREFLEALRSPSQMESLDPRASIGGWGLGEGNEDSGKVTEEEDDDETLDWDEAQAVVERMVGMQPSEPPPEVRRRVT